ncbi:MAG: uroporphyrinogen-III synthase [Aquabacterium sp.]
MRVLVTRPQPQADAWAADLRNAGHDAQALPLIAIEGPLDPAPVQALWQGMAAQALLMFVSPAAVDWFFRLRPPDAPWSPTTLAAAPGPGTARQLLAAGATLGLRPEQVLSPGEQAEQFDSEALWPLLAPLAWQGRQVCIVSGGDQTEAKGRTWLTGQWQAQGASVSSLLTYQRGPAPWTPAEQTLAKQALTQPGQHVWLFSSSQAIDFLAAHHVPRLSLEAAETAPRATPDWPQARALVTHPKIAERARRLGLTRITQTRPTLEAVVDALRSVE